MLSADEKSQLQVLSRCHPGLPPGPRRAGRYEFEYERHGTVAYLAAYDVHRARLMGRVEPTTGIAPFTALANQVMTQEPYASARRVFWVTDNGCSHNGRASVDRMAAAWPNAVLVHLPVHASWRKSDRGRLLRHPAEGHHACRFHGQRCPRRPAAGLPGPLQRHRGAVRLEVHPREAG